MFCPYFRIKGGTAMAKAGRKNKYDTHIKPYLKEIKDALERGVEENKIAESCGVSISSWCEYKNRYLEFAELFKKKDVSKILKNLDSALLKVACGYEYEEEKRVGRKDKDGEQIVVVEKYKKHQPPNVTAIFGAYNRFDPDYVKDKAYYNLKIQELELKKTIAEDNSFDGLDFNEKGKQENEQ